MPPEPPDRLGPVVRLDATVRGRVQGVGFRYFVIREAFRLGVTGWVANEGGASVRCVAEGSRQSLEMLCEALREGPPGAHVDGVAATWLPATGGFDRFDVRFGGHGGD